LNRVDRLAVSLSVAAALVLALSLSNAFPWLQGRLNGSFSGLLLNIMTFVAWAVLTIGLLWRLANGRGQRRPGTIRSRVFLGAVVFVPWLILVVQRDAMAAFTHGFRRWATTHVDVRAIEGWRAKLTTTAATAPARLWWPTTEREVLLGVPVSRRSFSPAVAGLRPDEVRVLPELEGVLFVWEGGRVGWVRFVFVGSAASGPPEELKRHDADWRFLQPGVYTGVVAHH